MCTDHPRNPYPVLASNRPLLVSSSWTSFFYHFLYDHLVAAGGIELGETAAPLVRFVVHIWPPQGCVKQVRGCHTFSTVQGNPPWVGRWCVLALTKSCASWVALKHSTGGAK